MTVDDIWNHNLHHQQVLLDALPSRCGSVLDVGCGQGFLLKHLAPRADEVVGIDRHAPSLE
jgi:2-polyprenyl-3-methyl-5-hydroxy-6-metoxy-1,4-benzoquinol methylase